MSSSWKPTADSAHTQQVRQQLFDRPDLARQMPEELKEQMGASGHTFFDTVDLDAMEPRATTSDIVDDPVSSEMHAEVVTFSTDDIKMSQLLLLSLNSGLSVSMLTKDERSVLERCNPNFDWSAFDMN
jgi:hypothetical protein